MGISVTGDAFNVFVFLEITSLSSYALISMGGSRRSLMAAYSYLIMGTIGGTFILVGIGFIYALTGTLNMADIAERLPAVVSSPTAVVAFGFLTLGVSIKLAVFPVYQWLPNAYSFAPSKVSAFCRVRRRRSPTTCYYVFFTLFGIGFVFHKLGLDKLLPSIARGHVCGLHRCGLSNQRKAALRLLVHRTDRLYDSWAVYLQLDGMKVVNLMG